MQEAVPAGVGAMAAVLGLAPEKIAELCAQAAQGAPGEVVSCANFNDPQQTVIAGHIEAVNLAAKLAGAKKLKAIPLKVSAPFHCALMTPAARAVAEALDQVELDDFRFPVISNVEAQPNSDSAKVKSLLVRQIAGTVRWQETMELIAAKGVRLALEIGPGKVLAGLARKAAPGLDVRPVFEPAEVAEAWNSSFAG